MRIFSTKDEFREVEFMLKSSRRLSADPSVTDVVERVVHDVATRGDEALFEYTEKFDGIALNHETAAVSREEIEGALKAIDDTDHDILNLAAERIAAFHNKQRMDSWIDSDEAGVELGQLIRPLDRVGIYAPGGLAAYPSTVLMAAIPARVAGVAEIILVTPSRGGTMNPLVLAAARLAGVDRIFKVGGAQAIAALAFGTETIPRVDKIVGPGNVYVATAKMMVFGHVGIDMVAGPSEIVIISDGSARPEDVAADLLSQAEHDEMACALLLTPVREFAEKVRAAVQSQLKDLKKRAIAARAIEKFGAIIVTKDVAESIDVANRFAPEHLELMVENPLPLLDKVKNAGAVFLGYNTPEAVGDYMAGPNHILPTGGTARFSSPLGVYDFVKRTSVISFSDGALAHYAEKIARFAELEGLEAHRRSIMRRSKKSIDKGM